ncbi:uncharacterized protein [Antedon mediterranea]|uniref:uncharacterized protein n=1 Tax=Antedon mediterranea TaxID=105859 RepID=UPI003AF67CC0
MEPLDFSRYRRIINVSKRDLPRCTCHELRNEEYTNYVNYYDEVGNSQVVTDTAKLQDPTIVERQHTSPIDLSAKNLSTELNQSMIDLTSQEYSDNQQDLEQDKTMSPIDLSNRQSEKSYTEKCKVLVSSIEITSDDDSINATVSVTQPETNGAGSVSDTNGAGSVSDTNGAGSISDTNGAGSVSETKSARSVSDVNDAESVSDINGAGSVSNAIGANSFSDATGTRSLSDVNENKSCGDGTISMIPVMLDNNRTWNVNGFRIPLHIRKKLIAAFEDNPRNYTTVADKYGIKRSTAGSIVRRHRLKIENHNTSNDVKQDKRLYKNLQRFLTLTNEHGGYIEMTCLTKHGKMVLSAKNSHESCGGSTTTDIKKQQLHYCEWFLQHGINGHCIYITELVFSILPHNVTSNDSRSEIHLIIAASQRLGRLGHKIQLGQISDHSRKEFLASVASKLNEKDLNFFIFDKWSKTKLDYDSPVRERISMIFLPQNSDFLSIFSAMVYRLVSDVHSILSQPGMLAPVDCPGTGLSIDKHYNLVVCKHLDDNIIKIEQIQFASWFHNIVKQLSS